MSADVHVRHVVAHAGGAEGSASVDRPSAIMYRVGGRQYPMRSVAQCKLCQSMEYRQEVENALLRGFSYATIHRSLPPEANLSVENIREHVERQHMPVDEAMRRVIIEEEARARGLSIEDATGTLVDHITFAKLGVQKVVERMARGELVPDVKDGIAMAQLLVRIQELGGEGVDNEVMVQGFMVYMEAMRRICTPEQITQMREMVSAHPVMAALMTRTAPPIPATSNGHP